LVVRPALKDIICPSRYLVHNNVRGERFAERLNRFIKVGNAGDLGTPKAWSNHRPLRQPTFAREAVAERLFSVLVNRDRDRLDVLIAMALARGPLAEFGERAP
jgi:hypothetical protein